MHGVSGLTEGVTYYPPPVYATTGTTPVGYLFELRRLAEKRHRALMYAEFLMLRARVFEIHGTLIDVSLVDKVYR